MIQFKRILLENLVQSGTKDLNIAGINIAFRKTQDTKGKSGTDPAKSRRLVTLVLENQ